MDNISAHSIATVVPGSSTGTVVPGSSTGTSGLLSPETIRATLEKGLAGKFTGQKILVLIPDHTRSLPLPFLFRALVEILGDTRPRARTGTTTQLDFMVALGTHPPLSEENLNKLVGITTEERASLLVGGGSQTRPYRVKILNHAWNDPASLATIGAMEA
ncbi:MAG: lactate racemase domain-containing protein, partial [Chloroflexi bacterium]|nr:lactate racemase domain-containing protein [Chloroflexota bacterium]